jgi:hypothetical protein
MLSDNGILVNSQGGAYAHNLIAGKIRVIHGEKRLTPYHNRTHRSGGPRAQSQRRRPLLQQHLRDRRIARYDEAKLRCSWPQRFLKGAKPTKHEPVPSFGRTSIPDRIGGARQRRLSAADRRSILKDAPRRFVARNARKGKIPRPSYEQPDGSSLSIDTDYFGAKTTPDKPVAPPLLLDGEKEIRLRSGRRQIAYRLRKLRDAADTSGRHQGSGRHGEL